MNNNLNAQDIINVYRNMLSEANDKIVILSAQMVALNKQLQDKKSEGEKNNETIKK